MDFDSFLKLLMGAGPVLSRLLLLGTLSFLIGYLNLGVVAYGFFFFTLSLIFFNSTSRALLRRMVHRRIQNRVVSQTNPSTETAEFLNKMAAMLHQMYSGSLDQWFKDKLNGLLATTKPDFLRSLKFKDLDLGGNPPILEAVTMVTKNENHFMQLDFVLSWDSKCQGTVVGKFQNVPGFSFSVLVEDFIVVARLRVSGLLHTTSEYYFGPMTVSVLDIPIFDLNLRTYGGVDLLNLPGIRSILREVVCGGVLKENILFPQLINFNLSDDIGMQDMLDAASNIRSLKTKHQYQHAALLKDADWLSLFRLGLKTKKYQPGNIIAIDVGKGISRPLLCRVVKGEVRMEVWRHSSSRSVDMCCLNHALEENSLLQQLASFDFEGEHSLGNAPPLITTFDPGDYFAEMTFVNPNVYNVSSPPPVPFLIVFIASVETEVAVAGPSVVEEACSDVGFEERFYRLVAVGLSANLRAYMKTAAVAPRGKEGKRGVESSDRLLSRTAANTKKGPSIRKVRSPANRLSDPPVSSPLASSLLCVPESTGMSAPKFDGDEKGPALQKLEPRLAVTPPGKMDSALDPRSVFRRGASPMLGRKRRNSASEEGYNTEDGDKRLFSRKAVSSAIGKKRDGVTKRRDEVSGLIRSQLTRSPTAPHRSQSPNHDTFRVYLKDSTGKFISRSVPIENITLEQCKQGLVDTCHNAVLGEAPRFFTVPKKNSKVQLQIGNATIRTGTTVMIEGSNMVGQGFVVYRSKKFVLQPTRPLENDTAAHFIVRMKGLIRLRDGSTATMISLKNVKSNGFISRPLVSKMKKIISSERMLGMEIIDVSSPTWLIFANLMTDPQPFHVGKDGATIYMGKSSDLLKFQLVPLDTDDQAQGGGEKEEDSFDPTVPLDESLLVPDVLRDNVHVSFVLSSEPPSDFHFRKKGEETTLQNTVKRVKNIRKKDDASEEIEQRLEEKQSEIRRFLNIRKGESLLYETRCRCCHNGGWITGRLYIFENYLGFHGSFFGNKISLALRLGNLTTAKIVKKTLIVESDIIDIQFRSRTSDAIEQALKVIKEQSAMASSDVDGDAGASPSPSSSVSLNDGTPGNDAKGGLTNEDWKELLKGAKVKCYERGALILQEGQPAGGLYQVSYGAVRIEKYSSESKRNKTVAHLPLGEIFGEMSFLSATKESMASASVVADDDEVDVYFISAEFIQKCFQTKGLGGRFFFFLALCLSKRFYKTINIKS